MNTDDLRNWLHAHGRGWEARSVEAASQLFSADFANGGTRAERERP